ncbi:MAG: Hsp20/alpha crystallin family protein [Bacteroidales bacterium]|nr:Hsp20/alpha crystallin family protein [Bacteroidales bacterium]
MYLVKRNQDMLPSLFNELLDWNNWGNHFFSEGEKMPKLNVSETDNDYELELCVPGLKKEDLNLSIDADNYLVVEMVQKEDHQDNDDKKGKRHYLRREFSTLQFKQMMALPENVKKDQISAKVEDGILVVTLPKVTAEEKKSLAQTIEIQ